MPSSPATFGGGVAGAWEAANPQLGLQAASCVASLTPVSLQGSQGEEECARDIVAVGTLGRKHETWVCRQLPRSRSKILMFCVKAFNVLPSPSAWKEIKHLNGIVKAGSATRALFLSVCPAGEVWPQARPANTCDPELTLGEGTRRSLRHTLSGPWA